MNIIWIGNPFFSSRLSRPGVHLLRLDCRPGEYLDWQGISSRAEALGCPHIDALVVADKSQPPFVLGVENFPCLTVLYAVDTHIHSWLPEYAQAFDLCLVSLKDDLPLFKGKRLHAGQLLWWPPYCIAETISPDGIPDRLEGAEAEPRPINGTMPPDTALSSLPVAPATSPAPDGHAQSKWARPQSINKSAITKKKNWNILFVGTVDPAINPERVSFLEAFKKHEPRLHFMRGNYRELYPQARLVLNHSVSGDLNFRVFEALGCGAALLTPRLGHGLEDLFTDGEDLFLFDQEDVRGAAVKAGSLLEQPELLKSVAWSGYEKVKTRHTASSRADEFIKLLSDWRSSGLADKLVQNRLARSRDIRARHLKLIYLLLADSWKEFPLLRAAYLAAALKRD